MAVSLRTLVVAFMLVIQLAPSGELAAADSALPNLADFRTVETCLKTEIKNPVGGAAALAPGRSGYLGVSVKRNEAGRLIVDEVAAQSPAAKAGLLFHSGRRGRADGQHQRHRARVWPYAGAARPLCPTRKSRLRGTQRLVRHVEPGIQCPPAAHERLVQGAAGLAQARGDRCHRATNVDSGPGRGF
jgi:hypothetical protein